jgi:hypothetical protein
MRPFGAAFSLLTVVRLTVGIWFAHDLIGGCAFASHCMMTAVLLPSQLVTFSISRVCFIFRKNDIN